MGIEYIFIHAERLSTTHLRLQKVCLMIIGEILPRSFYNKLERILIFKHILILLCFSEIQSLIYN